MLRLTLVDFVTKISAAEQALGSSLANVKQNATILHNKLPDLAKYKRKTASEIEREIKKEKGEPTLIDFTKKDSDEED